MPILSRLLNHGWYTFCFAVLLIFIQEILKLRSGRPDYDTFFVRLDSRPILVVCLRLGLKDNDCDHLERKQPFDCRMKYGLSCHTKGWKHLKKTYVISQIQSCNLERQILVYNDSSIQPEYDIHQDLFCIRFVHENFSAHFNQKYHFSFNASSKHDYFLHFVESVRAVVKKFFWHRKCFFNRQTEQFVCRNAEIGLINAQTVRKKHTEITNCANYGQDEPYREYSNQFECLRKCYKDHGTTETQKKQCREKVCPLIDCVFNHFYVDSISKSDNALTRVTVFDRQQITEVFDFIESDDVFLYVIGILSSLFGFNVLHRSWWLQRTLQHQVYSLLIRTFREHHRKLRRRNEKTKRSLKIFLLTIVSIVCVWQLSKALYRYFKFETKVSYTYDLSTSMINSGITVSICFAINDILIRANDSKSCNLSDCTLRELSEATLPATDLIEHAELSSVIRDQVVPVNESRWFFKDKSKCFDFTFKLQETKLDYFSRLVYIGIRTRRYFKQIYLRERGFNPTYSMPKQPSPYLTIYAHKQTKNNVFLKKSCEHYSFERDHCHSRESCVEKCIRELYLSKYPHAFSSHFIVTQEEIESNETIAKRTIRSDDGRFDFKKMKHQCQNRFLYDCEHSIYRSVNITYEQVAKRLENRLDCEFQVLIFTQSSFQMFSYDFNSFIFYFCNLTNLCFGFSIPLLFKWTIAWSYCLKLKLLSKMLKNLLIVTVASLFIVHLKSFVDLIIRNEKVSQMHLLEASSTSVPRVSLCLKFDNQSDVSPDGLIPAEIDKQTPSISDLVDSLHFYDSEFNEIVLDRTNFSRFLYDGNSYMKKQKKVRFTKLEDAFKIKRFYLAASKCFDLINQLKYNQIDYRLQRSPPLLRVQLNSRFESVIVVLNDLERINLENWHRLHRSHNMEFSFKRLKFKYTDHLYYLKHPLELIWPRKVLRQRAYFRDLHYEFFAKHNRTTTLIPLTNASYFGLEIDNQKFKSFYTNKSAEELELLEQVEQLPAIYTQNQFVEIIKLVEDLSLVNDERNKTRLKIYPFFLKYSLVVTNKQTRCDLFLYFTLICTLYLNVSFVQLPFFFIQNLVHLHKLFRGYCRFCFDFFKNF